VGGGKKGKVERDDDGVDRVSCEKEPDVYSRTSASSEEEQAEELCMGIKEAFRIKREATNIDLSRWEESAMILTTKLEEILGPLELGSCIKSSKDWLILLEKTLVPKIIDLREARSKAPAAYLKEEAELLIEKNNRLIAQNEDLTEYILELESTGTMNETIPSAVAISSPQHSLAALQREFDRQDSKLEKESERRIILEKDLDKIEHEFRSLMQVKNEKLQRCERECEEAQQKCTHVASKLEEAERERRVQKESHSDYVALIEKERQDLEFTLHKKKKENEDMQKDLRVLKDAGDTKTQLQDKKEKEMVAVMQRMKREKEELERGWKEQQQKSVLQMRGAKEEIKELKALLVERQKSAMGLIEAARKQGKEEMTLELEGTENLEIKELRAKEECLRRKIEEQSSGNQAEIQKLIAKLKDYQLEAANHESETITMGNELLEMKSLMDNIISEKDSAMAELKKRHTKLDNELKEKDTIAEEMRHELRSERENVRKQREEIETEREEIETERQEHRKDREEVERACKSVEEQRVKVQRDRVGVERERQVVVKEREDVLRERDEMEKSRLEAESRLKDDITSAMRKLEEEKASLNEGQRTLNKQREELQQAQRILAEHQEGEHKMEEVMKLAQDAIVDQVLEEQERKLKREQDNALEELRRELKNEHEQALARALEEQEKWLRKTNEQCIKEALEEQELKLKSTHEKQEFKLKSTYEEQEFKLKKQILEDQELKLKRTLEDQEQWLRKTQEHMSAQALEEQEQRLKKAHIQALEEQQQMTKQHYEQKMQGICSQFKSQVQLQLGAGRGSDKNVPKRAKSKEGTFITWSPHHSVCSTRAGHDDSAPVTACTSRAPSPCRNNHITNQGSNRIIPHFSPHSTRTIPGMHQEERGVSTRCIGGCSSENANQGSNFTTPSSLNLTSKGSNPRHHRGSSNPRSSISHPIAPCFASASNDAPSSPEPEDASSSSSSGRIRRQLSLPVGQAMRLHQLSAERSDHTEKGDTDPTHMPIPKRTQNCHDDEHKSVFLKNVDHIHHKRTGNAVSSDTRHLVGKSTQATGGHAYPSSSSSSSKSSSSLTRSQYRFGSAPTGRIPSDGDGMSEASQSVTTHASEAHAGTTGQKSIGGARQAMHGRAGVPIRGHHNLSHCGLQQKAPAPAATERAAAVGTRPKDVDMSLTPVVGTGDNTHGGDTQRSYIVSSSSGSRRPAAVPLGGVRRTNERGNGKDAYTTFSGKQSSDDWRSVDSARSVNTGSSRPSSAYRHGSPLDILQRNAAAHSRSNTPSQSAATSGYSTPVLDKVSTAAAQRKRNDAGVPGPGPGPGLDLASLIQKQLRSKLGDGDDINDGFNGLRNQEENGFSVMNRCTSVKRDVLNPRGDSPRKFSCPASVRTMELEN